MALLVAAQPEAYCAREPQARLQRERNEPQLPDALVPALGQLEHAHADEQRGQHQECAVGAGQHFDPSKGVPPMMGFGAMLNDIELAAVLSYVRLTQSLDESGVAHIGRVEETRVWQKVDGPWKHVHFHRSANA